MKGGMSLKLVGLSMSASLTLDKLEGLLVNFKIELFSLCLRSRSSTRKSFPICICWIQTHQICWWCFIHWAPKWFFKISSLVQKKPKSQKPLSLKPKSILVDNANEDENEKSKAKLSEKGQLDLRGKIQKLGLIIHEFKKNMQILMLLCLVDLFLKKPLIVLYDVQNSRGG